MSVKAWAIFSVDEKSKFYRSHVKQIQAQLRKRFLCSQLTDCAKVIEINVLKMEQFVAVS
jgi:mevalonate pyrophosphate decarboxylase